jgi:hypothetical protein
MIQKLKTMLLLPGAMALLMLIPALALTVTVSAQNIQDSLCSGANLDLGGDSTDCATGATEEDFQDTLNSIVNIISIIVGVIAVLMIIFGGFRYITSGGDAAKVTSAKNTILYGLIGLVIVALAQFIVKFVLNQVMDTTG